jgi:undecaprenyl diphosphate synthase
MAAISSNASARIAAKERNAVVPPHIVLIPDGNRRWAKTRGLSPESGYAYGVAPGISLLELSKQSGNAELSVYGFTPDNTRRPARQAVMHIVKRA